MVSDRTDARSITASARPFVVRLALAWVLMPLFLLATGGSVAWWQAWVFCAAVLVPMSAFVAYMARADPELLAWRLQTREKDRTQRRLVRWGTPVFVALFVLPGLDHRFGWSRVPLAAVVAADVAVVASYAGILWVFVTNRWAGRTVETRPGQQLVSTGPYAIVRHPMYAASIVLYLAMAVGLGSWWALIPAVLIVPVMVVRIRGEEEVLVRELAGYDAYRARVRYRLLPGLW